MAVTMTHLNTVRAQYSRCDKYAVAALICLASNVIATDVARAAGTGGPRVHYATQAGRITIALEGGP